MPHLVDDPLDDIRCDKDGIGGKMPPEQEERFRNGLEKLVKGFEYANNLKQLTNDQLADLLVNRVWAVLDITSEESAIVDEAIARLAPHRVQKDGQP